MNYSVIRNVDIANGPGCRVSLFVSGCSNKCKGCFQPETWDPDYGQPFTKETFIKIVDLASKPFIDGITILGGDPFYESNISSICKFIKDFRFYCDIYELDKTIWIYTGYTLDNLVCRNNDEINSILHNIDWLVDGPFIEDKKDISLQFRGSSNQRLIDIQKCPEDFSIIYYKDRYDDKDYKTQSIVKKSV